MFRIVAGVLTIVAAFGSAAFAGPISEDIPIPGGTMALARAVGLETPPDPARFVAELARLAYGLPDNRKDDPSTTLHRLTAHLDAAARFQSALDALAAGGDGAVTLAWASDDKDHRNDRDHLKAFLEVVGLRLKETQAKSMAEATNDKAAAARIELLSDLGVDLERLESRLNAGETVHLKVPTELVPVPLTAALWGETVFHRSTPASHLFSALFSDPQAALLCRGLAGLDDETLQYVAETPRLIERLYGREEAAAFSTFASSVRVHDGRVAVPGGAAAVPLWESVVNQKVTEPDAFIRELLTQRRGHVAYLYDVISELDAPRAAFALGLWIPDDHVRIDRFRSLTSAVDSQLADWLVRELPFARPLDDIAWMLLNVPTDATGAPHGPAARLLWTRAFESADLPVDPAGRLKNLEKDGLFDAAWLAENILLSPDQKVRSSRIQQLAFGLRVFGAAPGDRLGDAMVAIRAFPAYPALMLTLERMGISEPAVYAVAARTARRLSELGGRGAFTALNQFQGSLAMLARMTASGSLEPQRTQALVAGLVAIMPGASGRYGGLVAQWIRRDLLPVMPSRADVEQAVLTALAGRRDRTAAGPVRVSWEGEQYRLDLAAAGERRLRLIHDRQHAYSIQTALDLEQIAETLGAASLDLASVRAAVAALQSMSTRLGAPENASRTEVLPPGLQPPPSARAIVDRAVKELSKITQSSGAKRAARVGEPLFDLSDAVLGEALSSIAYAIDLGDARESTLLGVDLSRRHDYGLALQDATLRRRTAWSIPHEVVEAGTPRRVQGSLLGLDIAFARSSLRVVTDGAGGVPVLLSNDREVFTKSVALLNPYALRDADRDAIAAAVSRGRARVDALTMGRPPIEALDAIARQIKLDGWRRRAAAWDILHDPPRVPSLFSLNELLVLGAGNASSFAAWGMAGTPVSGCLCTRLASPNEWRIVGGRPQIGVYGTVVSDLNLHVAVMLAALKLPASLAKTVLGAAVQEFVDRVRPNDVDDWLTLTREARAVSRERIEDYVAAATVDGPLMPEAGYAGQP